MGTRAYNREHTKTYLLRFNYKTDPDIIQFLDQLDNKVGYFKRIIREDLKRTAKTKKEAPGSRESSPSTAPGSR